MNSVSFADWLLINEGKHFCHCGCGRQIKLLRQHFQKGKIPRWVPEHRSRRSPQEFMELFNSYIRRDVDGCWEWIGGKDALGYGRICYMGQEVLSHRQAYLLFVGEVPSDSFVLHSCDNPACVRPDHLRLGTHLDNMVDKIVRGRAAKKLTPEVVWQIISAVEIEGLSFRRAARRFGLNKLTISKIVRGENWSHVTGKEPSAVCMLGKHKALNKSSVR